MNREKRTVAELSGMRHFLNSIPEKKNSVSVERDGKTMIIHKERSGLTAVRGTAGEWKRNTLSACPAPRPRTMAGPRAPALSRLPAQSTARAFPHDRAPVNSFSIGAGG